MRSARSHWVAPRRRAALGARSHPRLMQHKEAPCKTLYSAFPTFCFPLLVWIFFLVSRASCWLGKRCFTELREPPRRSVERGVCKPEFVIPVPGSGARAGPARPVPAPWCPRAPPGSGPAPSIAGTAAARGLLRPRSPPSPAPSPSRYRQSSGRSRLSQRGYLNACQ